MKKGKSFRLNSYRFRTMASTGYFGATLVCFIFFVISLTSLIINITICCIFGGGEKDLTEDICNIVLSSVSLILSGVGTVSQFVRIHRNYFQRQHLHQKEYKEEQAKAVSDKISGSHAKSHYAWKSYNGQKYLESDTVNGKLFEKIKELRVTVCPKKHAMSIEQKETLYKIVSEKIAQGKSIFNSNLVRLRSDMLEELFENDEDGSEEIKTPPILKRYTDNKLVKLEKTDYYSNLTTNDLIFERFFKYDYSSVFCGKELTVDGKDTLFDLSQSPAANIVGVSTLAITSDGFIVINRQNNNNDINNDCFVPSGSGSSDFEDLKKCSKFEPEQLREDVNCSVNSDYEKNYKKSLKAYLKELGKPNAGKEEGTAEKEYKKRLVEKKAYAYLKRYSGKMKRYTYNFDTFLKYGMVRELIEESHLSEKPVIKKGKKTYKKIKEETLRKYIDNTFVCGYIRILDRGGKPDFFGITFLDLKKNELAEMFDYRRRKITRKELAENCSVTDFNEVCEQEYVHLDEIDKYNGVDEFIRCEIIDKKPAEERKTNTKNSLQIHCLFELLRKNKDAIKSKIKDLQSV